MWFAALGTYHQNPWLMSFAFRLLNGQKEVLALINNVENPFRDNPPKYVKASLYHYHYTQWSQRWSQSLTMFKYYFLVSKVFQQFLFHCQFFFQEQSSLVDKRKSWWVFSSFQPRSSTTSRILGKNEDRTRQTSSSKSLEWAVEVRIGQPQSYGV